MVKGPFERKTNIRFRNIYDYENHINAIDINYDSEEVDFTGYVHKLNTPQFKVVKRSAFAKDTNYLKEFVEHYGQNCYIPKSGNCFIKCINDFTKKDYSEEFRDIFRGEKN